MANELQCYGPTGEGIYAVIRNYAGLVWSTTAEEFQAYSNGNWANYAITCVEQGTSGFFQGDMPVVEAGVYLFEVRQKASIGAGATLGDLRVGATSIIWDGLNEIVDLSKAKTKDGVEIGQALTELTAVLLGETNVVSANRVQFKNRNGDVVVDITYGDTTRGLRESVLII
jgi:hypothetical protein